ncbi:MAG: TPM domain-containing protein [Oscillospiraceae bacterium]|jgi:uncharacterized membrane protein YgcG|nr:TPM domain-containing protein [Oscillospiraceae bacterium]
MRGIVIFVLCIAAVGAAMGGVAAGVKNKKVNIFKTQAGAWLFTIVMVTAAIDIGYAKSPLAGTQEPRPDVPNAPASADSYVWDDANVLSGQTERELDERNERLWNTYSVTIGVVTCDNERDLGDYALACAEKMGLGGYDFLVALDIAGENYWLVQGDDIRRVFTDDDCSDYAYDCMEKHFAAGDYDNAVLKLTKALEDWYGNYYG